MGVLDCNFVTNWEHLDKFIMTKLQSKSPYMFKMRSPLTLPCSSLCAVQPFDIHTAFEGHFVKTGDQPKAGTTPVRCLHLDGDHTHFESGMRWYSKENILISYLPIAGGSASD